MLENLEHYFFSSFSPSPLLSTLNDAISDSQQHLAGSNDTFAFDDNQIRWPWVPDEMLRHGYHRALKAERAPALMQDSRKWHTGTDQSTFWRGPRTAALGF